MRHQKLLINTNSRACRVCVPGTRNHCRPNPCNRRSPTLGAIFDSFPRPRLWIGVSDAIWCMPMWYMGSTSGGSCDTHTGIKAMQDTKGPGQPPETFGKPRELNVRM